MCRIFFILGIVFGFISCQSSDFSQREDLQLTLYIQSSNAFIHRINQSKLANLETSIIHKDHYKPILSQAQSIAIRTKKVYDNISLFYEQITGLSLKVTVKKEDLKTFQSLRRQATLLQEESLQLIKNSWNNGGIKATIFADSTKRKQCIQIIETALIPLSLGTQNKLLPFSKNSLLLTTLSLLQQKIKQNERVFINFFANLVGGIRICGPRAFASINSSKTCIRLGETYEAAINISQIISCDNYKVMVDDSILEKQHPYRTIYKIPTKAKGEQAFLVSIILEDPLTQKQTFIRTPFYYEVTP